MLDKEYLPSNPMWLSDLKAKVWDSKAKYCMKVNVSGLQIYPDFGHLLDFGAYYDEEYFWWEDPDVKDLLNSSDPQKKTLGKFVSAYEDYTVPIDDFTGMVSRQTIGTFVIDGSKLTKDIVIAVKTSGA